MFRWVVSLALALRLAACTELPPPPEVGTGGTGGSCFGIMLERRLELDSGQQLVDESNDGVVCSAELLYVASGYVSSENDNSDVWSMTGDGGSHDILLTWDEMEQGFDLDLVLLDSELRPIGMGKPGANPSEEELLGGVELPASEQFYVEVQALNTSGVSSLNYNLIVSGNY